MAGRSRLGLPISSSCGTCFDPTRTSVRQQIPGRAKSFPPKSPSSGQRAATGSNRPRPPASTPGPGAASPARCGRPQTKPYGSPPPWCRKRWGSGLSRQRKSPPHLGGQAHRLLVAQGDGPAAGGMGQRPIVAVVGDAQLYLSRRDLRHGIAHHLRHLGKGRHRHRWAVGIPPLVRHQEYGVCNGSHGAVIVALVKKPLLVRMGLGGQIYVKRQAHLV